MLDAAETLGTGYLEKEVAIETGDGILAATLYYAISIDAAAIPYDWYRAIVVSGAREQGFPQSYVESLERAAARPDPDAARAQHHFRLAETQV